MKFIIHGEYQDGTQDSIVIEADTIDEIRSIAACEVEKRSWTNCWSEEV